MTGREPLALLRYRDGGDDEVFKTPIALVGRVIHLDEHVVTISGGRGSFKQVIVEDLYALLGGPKLAIGVLLDAAEHGDEIRIRLAPGRLSYDNPKQRERLAKVVLSA